MKKRGEKGTGFDWDKVVPKEDHVCKGREMRACDT